MYLWMRYCQQPRDQLSQPTLNCDLRVLKGGAGVALWSPPRIFSEASRMVAMDTKNSPEVWDRLTNESGRAYEAFKVYMYLPPAERTVTAAWRRWTENPETAPAPSSRDGHGSTPGPNVLGHT